MINKHANDIAVIVLAHKVSFSNGVTPVCVDWKSEYNVVNGAQGKVNFLCYSLLLVILLNT